MSYFVSDNIKYIIFNLIYYRETRKRLEPEKILACPVCKGDLLLKDIVTCQNCKASFPIKEGIFYLRTSDIIR